MPDSNNPNPPNNPPGATPPPPPTAPPPPASSPDFGKFSIAEEMDSAKWTLPPIVPLLIGLVLVAIVVVVVVFSNRDKPSASLAITKVVSAAEEDNTMVAMQIKIENQIAGPLWIKGIRAELETADGKKISDNAAPGMDGPRYMQAFPVLEEAKADWLKEELKIPSKTSFTGVAIFSYPVTKAVFDARKQLKLHIQLYDLPGLVATSPAGPAQ
jgi:hypothetical protein